MGNNKNGIKENLTRYMEAGFPLIYLDTFEEEKAERLVSTAAGGRGLIIWSVRGFVDVKEHVCRTDQPLLKTLEAFASDQSLLKRKVLILKDAFPLANDREGKRITYLLKFLAQAINNGLEDCNIVIISTGGVIPPELQPYITMLSIDYLDTDEIAQVIRDFCAEQEVASPSAALLDELSLSFKGLSEFDVRNILYLALTEDGEITKASLNFILDQKKQIIQKSDILEMISSGESLDDVGGLYTLKRYLRRKAEIIRNIDKAQKFGISLPKGILIAGMPGCGKSLCAKAAAKEFGVPLLRLDVGRLMGKYVGESEANMRKAIRLAEAIAPCVLWVDELEKAFAGIGGEGGGAEVTTRLFGAFLTWLQEKKSLVFVVATANDLSKTPQELLRRGRFDELFYVGFPNRDDRQSIFEIHIRKHRPGDLPAIDLKRLADRANGFSGADIEGAVSDSIEDAFCQHQDQITTDDLLAAIKEIRPLSKTMADKCKEWEDLYKKLSFKNAAD